MGKITSDVRFAITPEWVLDADVSDRAVRLYAVLNRYANVKDTASPSRKTLADRLRCSPDSIDRALVELDALGAIDRTPRRRPDGSRTSNEYHLRVQPRGHPSASAPRPPSAPATSHPSAPVPRHEREQGMNENNDEREQSMAPTAPSAFDAFWNTYPRHDGGRQHARDAFDRAVRRGADPGTIVAGAWRYAADANREDAFTAHAATWLNQGRWDDPPLPARSSKGGAADRILGAAVAERRREQSDGERDQDERGPGIDGAARRGLPGARLE